MILKRAGLVAAATILLDQMSKILVKTNMFLGESSFKDWNCGFGNFFGHCLIVIFGKRYFPKKIKTENV